MQEYLVKGFLIALIFGIPAGAIGALTIQRSLKNGFIAGFVTGLGSSAADTIYACVGVFGVTIISNFLTTYQGVIEILGGILIATVGINTFRTQNKSVKTETRSYNGVIFFISSFSMAILNPATVVSFLLAFTTFDITGNLTVAQGSSLVIGILIGTCCWWATISGVVTIFRKKITNRIYAVLNNLLGVALFLFGAVMVARGIIHLI